MPKPPNPKCILCAQLPANQAKQVHGAEGDGCWESLSLKSGEES